MLRLQAEFREVIFEDLERYGPKYDPIILPEEGGDLDVFFNESDHHPLSPRRRRASCTSFDSITSFSYDPLGVENVTYEW